ncbi:D-aminoacyl-tRNA deacylase [Rhodothermus bifroesti]|uniref:D-aminoacyl-tRNA deacylase n=1 Tax=Rhodothermus marinus TaxID=29549 RepID=A0A7V2B1L3_RHOMR|nr:D-aminoacyl-tRNA deacylase [Rhodothermus bifroesti]GBD01583.1 D-aminoacyl-tRNA deacylase [bacterium HR18]
MVALVQRVAEASVEVNGQITGAIGRGLLILLGVHRDDTEAEADWLARKCAHLRIFPDEEGKMNRSLKDVGGQALVVSQFTLYGDVSRGHRPSFTESAAPEKAECLYQYFVQRLAQELGQTVPTGVFGAMMRVHLVNDGPVTLWVERKAISCHED